MILAEIRKVHASGLDATRVAQRETVARLLKARPAGVLELFPVWTEMTTGDWQRLLHGVEDVDIVMNFCDTLIEGLGPTFRSVFDRGGRIRLWLPDPSNAEPIDRLVRLYGGTRDEIARRIVKSAVHLDWLREKSEHNNARAEIRLMQEMLTSPLIRLDRTRVLLSRYDQFYEGHANALAVLLDLTESPKLLAYWDDQFKEFNSRAPVRVDLLRDRAGWALPSQ